LYKILRKGKKKFKTISYINK